jgi:cation diffusion facilitator CzcD-associated flavoprotein CzcO
MEYMRTVAIIGAGSSGLVAAKVLLVDGFDVTLFEKNASLGGIWSFEGSYYNLHTQQPGGTMEYSDLYDGKGN